LQEVTWTACRVVRIGGLTRLWTGCEVRLLGITAGVGAEACRQRMNESAATATLTAGATTGATDAAAGRTTVGGTVATTTIAHAVAHPIAMTIAAKKTAVAEGTAIAVAAIATISAASIAAARIAATTRIAFGNATLGFAAFFAIATRITDAAFGFATNVATTTGVATALAGHAAVRTTACRQAKHGNDNHELFHQKSP
jgi:hypothetical protein